LKHEGKKLNRTEDDEKVIIGTIYSILDNSNLRPQKWFPRFLKSDTIQNIIRRVNLYFSEKEDWLDKILILPIPLNKFLGLTYFFEEPTGISSRTAIASITILIEEGVYDFFYQNIERLKRDLENFTKELKNTNKEKEIILSQFYIDLDEFMNRYQKIQNFTGIQKKIEEMRKQCVLFSYFNSKVGPKPFYCYPENSISKNDQYRLSKELEFGSAEGFFIKSYAGFNVVHLYFELESSTARGGVEMCLLSLIFNELPSKEMLETISFQLFDLIDKLQSKSEISLLFSEGSTETMETRGKIKQMSDYLREWVIEVHQSCIENYLI